MKRPNRLPIDGYIIDHNIKEEKLYPCSYCGNLTPNYSRCTLTKVMDDEHACDDCYDFRWPSPPTFD